MKKELVLEFVDCYAKKDKRKILSLLADNAVVSDPHFPFKTMQGHKQLSRGLSWSFDAIKSTNLNILDFKIVDDTAFVELDTVHKLKIGIEYHYVQLLKIKTFEGKITNLVTYVTYSPGGIRGIFRNLYSISWQAGDAVRGAMQNRLIKTTSGTEAH